VFKLVISDDEGKTTVVPLVHEEVTIGRDEDNRICLTERNVSRRHAKLARLNGTYAVEDLDSYTGVRVNGHKIAGQSKLKAGDQIGIGDFLLAFHAGMADSMTDPAAHALDATDPFGKAADTASQETAILRAPGTAKPARLVMLTDPDAGGEYPMTGATMRIGRFDGAQVWVNHKSISREHAQLAPSGDAFRIQDLGSANGVRVNGKDVRDVELRSGDIIELGQVRFRYVGAGESYTYDPADGTGQTTALGYQDRSSRAPLYAVIVILIACLGAVAFVALSPRTAEPSPPAEVVAQAAPTLSDAEIQSAVQDCRRAIVELRFQEAIAAAQRVLELHPSQAAAVECRRAAQLGLDDRGHYDSGSNALRAGDGVAAYASFMKLSDGSDFVDSPEVAEAAKLYAEHHLRAAAAALKQNPEEARAAAAAVLGMREVTPEWQRAAQKVLEQVGAGSAGGSGARGGATTEDGPEPRPRQPRPRATEPREATASEPSASATQQCVLEGGDVNGCVVRKIGPSAKGAGELSELILAYQGQRDTANMLRAMKRFIELYPNHPKSRAYGQVVVRHEGQ
jgi:pSer/pThr/pTyr-binding forkhead associated (FHA) protein